MKDMTYVPEQTSVGLVEPKDTWFTFRDPAGQLMLTPTHALRRIQPGAVAETMEFLASPLRVELEQRGDLIATEVVRFDELDEAFLLPPACLLERDALWLRHPCVDPISYPWEWTAAQWRSAAELTLQLADRAIDAGWTLKDATPLNILFVGARPVLVDVLSFERRDRHARVWLAYGQFVRTFLLPLIARKYLGWPLQATLSIRDGYEPGTIYRALQLWQRIYPDLLDVVTLAALFEGRGGQRSKPGNNLANPRAVPTDPALAAHILHRRIARLRKQIRNTAQTKSRSEWSQYTQTASHYSTEDTRHKQEYVRDVLMRCTPRRVLDIGANTGTYSLLAAEAGAKVVALDSDTAAMESLWRTASRDSRAITALVGNIARPSPGMGWMNREQQSLLERLAGKSDMVLMLAVIHHLILREQVPLAHIAELCARLTTCWLLLEWVPPSDPMYQEWLRGREALYGHLSEADLICAFTLYFQLDDKMTLGNGRVLFLFQRSDAAEQEANRG